ncbi:hypothetical protein GCM10017655_47530 [Pseudomonas turukhanskensis]|uniref:HMA domain-containing protein n=1 Tax=Pseudomonas turukhanskensis TaxID=1806536 RepID=A0A9W6NHC2_9PSED|nr:hypothetical protein GCM10017655_47530 [Pseudomonas turukhanskensis]
MRDNARPCDGGKVENIPNAKHVLLSPSRLALSPETAKGDYAMSRIELKVQGMSCSSCVKHINAVLRPIAGVNEVTVDLPSDQVTVRGDTAAPC